MNDSERRTGGAYLTNTPTYRFCPVCGHTLHSKVIKSTEPERLVCEGCGFVFYLDPKVAVGTIGTINGEIFLLKRSIEPALGKWVFPGGYVERGETLEAAAVREAAEESNLEVKIDGLLNVYSYEGRPIVVVVYAVTVVGGKLSAGDEALETRLFRPEDIPWQDLAFPSTRDALSHYLRTFFPHAPTTQI
jgi:mutator protein MutT